jgi:hypothetical protein
MVVFQRTADIAPGKLKEAMAFAFQTAAKASELVGAKGEVLVPYAGNPHELWLVEEARKPS